MAALESCVYETSRVPEAAGELGAACRAAGQEYDKQSKEMAEKVKQGEKVDYAARGSPHILAFTRAMQWAVVASGPNGKHAESAIGVLGIALWGRQR